ncbi:xanthine dehydrogenase family protein molybdopterin-binding subunit [Bordetella bronchialis]|uniref:Acylaldehyde oxidase n=1 Tax=Bordetella bronchialis TaxID=463025 RepID=A0ABN4R768_9BORD|nr:xanthine dehydrogenase family protein molybdopterin-binding subunit [Bordetella bronchialis]ANN67081.1 acylaldehyde oxidase [Bordetella bronchialis]
MNGFVGMPAPRVDGRDKVTGAARYAADFQRPGQAYAVVVGATVGLGRVASIDTEAVAGMSGVIGVLTHRNAPRLAYRAHRSFIDPGAGERLHVLQDEHVRFHGQPVAVVIARTPDSAEHAAMALPVRYEADTPIVDPHDPGVAAIVPTAFGPERADHRRGEPEAAPGTDLVTIRADYEIARQNHTPIELHATTAEWRDDGLTLWSKSQFVANERDEIAAVFGLAPDQVQVVCPYVGGAFGTSLRTWPHVVLAAMAARLAGCAVKLVLSRRQTFHATGYRPRSMQHVELSATPDGQLRRIVHEGHGETSRFEEFTEAMTSATSYLYACPNVLTRYRLRPLDVSTPTHMRGPGEASGIYALECAMDELAHALEMDPVDLRRRNETSRDEGRDLPFSSRSMLACYDMGAERFGWSRRERKPGSMRDGRLLLGWGMAASTYPVFFAPAGARARILPGGRFEIEAAASDMGPGTYTSMTQVAADALGVPMDSVRFCLGDSRYPATPPHGGSMTMASVGSAVLAACRALQEELLRQLEQASGTPLTGEATHRLSWRDGMLADAQGSLAMPYAQVLERIGGRPVEATATGGRDPAAGERFSMHAWGAVFVEIAIDPDVYTMKVRRMVGAYDAGRIVNPRLARSQCVGGMIGGIGMALMEATALDRRDGRPVNAHMADYLMPVNRDIGDIDVCFVDGHDAHANPLGVKGLGEIALVGVAPAIANAVFHATGKRLRNLPIRIEHLLEGG